MRYTNLLRSFIKMKEFFTISQTAKIAGVTSETLRHYDRIGLVKPCKVDEWTGYRYYSQQEIVRLNTIHALRCMDLSLAEIKEILSYENFRKITEKVADNFGKISNVTNYAQIIGGVALILFGSLVFWIIWIFSKLIFSTLCDIEFIRNKLYQLDNDNLKSFIEEEEEESDNTTNDNKKKSFLEKFKDL